MLASGQRSVSRGPVPTHSRSTGTGEVLASARHLALV